MTNTKINAQHFSTQKITCILCNLLFRIECFLNLTNQRIVVYWPLGRHFSWFMFAVIEGEGKLLP